MVKSKKVIFFFTRKTCDEDEKNVCTSTKLKKLYENLRIEEKEKKKTSLKFLELHIMNLKIL